MKESLPFASSAVAGGAHASSRQPLRRRFRVTFSRASPCARRSEWAGANNNHHSSIDRFRIPPAIGNPARRHSLPSGQSFLQQQRSSTSHRRTNQPTNNRIIAPNQQRTHFSFVFFDDNNNNNNNDTTRIARRDHRRRAAELETRRFLRCRLLALRLLRASSSPTNTPIQPGGISGQHTLRRSARNATHCGSDMAR